jgi:hypothetical protein
MMLCLKMYLNFEAICKKQDSLANVCKRIIETQKSEWDSSILCSR